MKAYEKIVQYILYHSSTINSLDFKRKNTQGLKPKLQGSTRSYFSYLMQKDALRISECQ